MDRTIQVGDYILFRSGENAGYLYIDYVDPEIMATDVTNPNNKGKIILLNGQWKIQGLFQEHILTFISKDEYNPEDYLSKLPPDILRKVALVLPVSNIVNVCTINKYLKEYICDDEQFWQDRYVQDYGVPREIDLKGWKYMYRYSNNLYVIGLNDNGQLGTGNTDHVSVLTLIQEIKAETAAVNVSHSIVIDIHNNVWAAGDNQYGQLGLTDTRYARHTFFFVQIPELKGKSASLGCDHTLVLDIDNSVWVFGKNDRGQLGVDFRYNFNPVKLPNIKAKAISAGSFHSLILDFDGNVWVLGDNKCGQLGLGEQPYNYENYPVKILDIKAKAIAAGHFHSMIIDHENNVLVFGADDDGQLGLDQFYHVNVPTKLPNIKAKKISTNASTSLILSEDNIVYGFGVNEYGQLGNHSEHKIFSPVKVFDFAAADISAGFNHSLITDTDGYVWLLGKHVKGGLFNKGQVPPVKLNNNIRAKAIAAGYGYSLIVSE